MSKITYIIKWKSKYTNFVKCERYFYTLADAIEQYIYLSQNKITPEMWIEEPNTVCIKLN